MFKCKSFSALIITSFVISFASDSDACHRRRPKVCQQAVTPAKIYRVNANAPGSIYQRNAFFFDELNVIPPTFPTTHCQEGELGSWFSNGIEKYTICCKGVIHYTNRSTSGLPPNCSMFH